MRFLKTNTAVRVTVGPFFDKTDGVTPETALTVTNCKLTLVVDTGDVPTLVLDTNPTASGGSNDMVHITGDDAGFYDLELAAANVNYVGRAMLALTDAATHCPVFHEFMILPAMVYDSLVGGSDTLQVDVTQYGGTNGTFASGRPEVNISHFGGSAGTFSGGRPEVNVSHLGGSAVDQSGGLINANVKQISGDATAADNLESYTDGSEFMPVDAFAPDWNISTTPGSITVYKPDGTTVARTKPYTTDGAAAPITSTT